MTDPAGGHHHPAVVPGQRHRVPRHPGPPQVHAQPLRDRAHLGPAGGRQCAHRRRRGPVELGEVVVLDHQDLGELPEERPQFVPPRGGEGRPGGALRARAEDDGPHAGPQRRPQRVRPEPLAVDGHRHHPQSQRGHQVEEVVEAGVLDGHRVPGPELHREQPGDAVERPVREGHPLRGHPVPPEPRPGQLLQGGESRRRPVRAVDGPYVAGRVEHRQEGGIGQTAREVRQPLRHARRPPGRHRRRLRHDRAAPPAGHHEPSSAQFLVRGRHRARTDPQVVGELPYGRQRVARGEFPLGHPAFDGRGDLLGCRPLNPILCCHIQNYVPIHKSRQGGPT